MNIYVACGDLELIQSCVVKKVNVRRFKNVLPKEKRKLLKDVGEKVSVWGLTWVSPEKWKGIRKGDYVLFYNNDDEEFPYVAKVVLKHKFDEREYVGRLPCINIEERPYVIFLRDVIDVGLTLSEFRAKTHYRSNKTFSFFKIGASRTVKLMRDINNRYRKRAIYLLNQGSEEQLHKNIAYLLWDIGDSLNFRAKKEWKYGRYRYDVAWFKPRNDALSYVFEIQIEGDLERAIKRLRFIRKKRRVKVVIVTTKKLMEKVREKLYDISVPYKGIYICTIEELLRFYYTNVNLRENKKLLLNVCIKL